MKFAFLIFAALNVFPLHAGDGGFVKVDEAPVYSDADAKEPAFKFKKYDLVTGHTGGMMSMNFSFEKRNGRVQVQYFREMPGFQKSAWMNGDDLVMFQWDGTCNQWGLPFAQVGMKNTWNSCILKAFNLARDKLLFANFKAPEIDNKREFHADMDKVWSALIETCSDQKWQIESIDKSSGLITTKPANDSGGGSMVCATAFDGNHKVWLNIFVKSIEGGTRVKVNATFQAVRDDQTISCFSNGEIEISLFNGIQNNLPQSPAPVPAASTADKKQY